jgi:hypothetical protein
LENSQMKKTLIAMAAVAVAGAASAQVTIGGTLTFDAMSSTKTTTTSAADLTTSSTVDAVGGADTLTTPQLTMSGSEDLGGGMSIGFVMNSHGNGGTIAARDRNVSLSGDFGTVRVGRFIPAAAYGWYGFTGNSTTSIGSAYTAGMDAATYSGYYGAATTALTAAGSFERNDNQIQYTTSINGVTVNANYGSTSTDASEYLGTAQTKQQGISASYAAGALTVAMGQNSRSVDFEGASGSATGTQVDGDLDWYGASYDFGVAKATFANMQRKDQSALAATGVVSVVTDMNINSFGVSVPVGALTLSASMYRGTNDGSTAATDNYDLTGNQLFASYALSKRTSVYAVTGDTNAARASANTTSVTTKRSRTAVGMLHSF